MLISWFSPGTRAHGVPYAAGFGIAEDPRRPRVLDGDPELFHHYSQISPYAQSHVAFALCFDHLVPRGEATAVHHQILNAMMPARVEGAVLTLGIQHEEPGPFGARDRSAVHGFVSCRDLFRGRFFQPAFRTEAQYRLELAQELINQSAPYISPKDPENARAISVSTRPRAAGRSETVDNIRSAIRLIGDDLLSAETLLSTLRCFGADDVEVDGGRAGRLAASFTFLNGDRSVARARVMIRPGQAEKLMSGSSLRHLYRGRYVRSLHTFELLRAEFLTQTATATESWGKKHDTDLVRFEEVMGWAHDLQFAPLEKTLPRPATEVFSRMPGFPAPEVTASRSNENNLGIRHLSPPAMES